MKNIILLSILLLAYFHSSAQNCKKYHKKKCKVEFAHDFEYSAQSRSGRFTFNQESEFTIIAFGKKDYHVTVCAQKQLGKIHWKIVEADDPTKVIYDNAVDEFAEDKIFRIENTKKLIVQIKVPPSEKPEEEYNNIYYCLGVMIEYGNIPNVGF